MMKLIGCKFEGLEGFETLELDELKDLTSLTGPNGAGKSSILHVLKLVFEILAQNAPCDQPPAHDPWHRFNRATLRFNTSQPATLHHFDGRFDGRSGDVVVELFLNQDQYEISNVAYGGASVSFPGPHVTNKTMLMLRSEVAAAESTRKDWETRLASPQHPSANQTPQQLQQAHQQRQQWGKELESAKELVARKTNALTEHSLVTVQLSGDEQTRQIQRAEVEDFLSCLQFPSVEHVDARQLYEEAIPELIKQLLVQKKGRDKDNDKFRETIARLKHLVQASVEVSDVNEQESMHVNGVEYRKASSGTQITLAFFGLTRLGEPNCVILWDEPENGLHPTRRARLLDLMFDDKRQFILATHASEFAPVFSDKGKVFRCEAKYDSENAVVGLSVQHVADRREAFITLEALGVHPARALFTANVVIWVEGPTELLFYRHWLVRRLEKRGFHEGFHFTFMQYGGALVSYLTIADDEQFVSTFDLLSMCRHPIIIVDSDLRKEPGNQLPSEFLKKGAARIFDEVETLNKERSGAALFEWTSGREVENYLPESAVWHAVSCVWQTYKNHETELRSRELQIGRYDSYEEALEKHFIAAGVVRADKDEASNVSAKGASLWGSGNKVEMMRSALTMPDFTEADLQWGCSSLLHRIEDFVVKTSEK